MIQRRRGPRYRLLFFCSGRAGVPSQATGASRLTGRWFHRAPFFSKSAGRGQSLRPERRSLVVVPQPVPEQPGRVGGLLQRAVVQREQREQVLGLVGVRREQLVDDRAQLLRIGGRRFAVALVQGLVDHDRDPHLGVRRGARVAPALLLGEPLPLGAGLRPLQGVPAALTQLRLAPGALVLPLQLQVAHQLGRFVAHDGSSPTATRPRRSSADRAAPVDLGERGSELVGGGVQSGLTPGADDLAASGPGGERTLGQPGGAAAMRPLAAARRAEAARASLLGREPVQPQRQLDLRLVECGRDRLLAVGAAPHPDHLAPLTGRYALPSRQGLRAAINAGHARGRARARRERSDPEADVVEIARELRDAVGEMKSKFEKRLQALERGSGYTPDDVGAQDGLGRPRGEVQRAGLGPRDSLAQAVASGRGEGAPPRSNEFSLGRIVQAMVRGDRGLLTDVERQALVEGTDAQGGLLVGEEIAPTVIDMVRDRTVVIEAGATTLPMGSDTYTWPRVLTGATPKWKAELEPMEESHLTFGALKLDARTLRTKVVMSQELVEDISPAGSLAIENELLNAFALELDRAALYGAGGVEPLGVKNTPGVLLFNAVGTPEDYDFLAQAIAAIRGANHEPNAVVLSAAAAGTLDTLKATDNQPLQRSPSVAALEWLVTNLVGGAPPASGDAFVAEWPQLVIGVRPSLGVRIRQIDARLAQDFAVEIVAWQRADVALQDPKAFAVASGISSAPAALLYQATATSASYEGMTVAELQQLCTDRGLATSGTKTELIARLAAADAA